MSDLPKQTITLKDGTHLLFLATAGEGWIGIHSDKGPYASRQRGADIVGLITPSIARKLLEEFSDANRQVHSDKRDGDIAAAKLNSMG